MEVPTASRDSVPRQACIAAIYNTSPIIFLRTMSDLVIEQCLPSERSSQIAALFDRAGRSEFPGVYERVYKPREALGLRSWVGSAGDRTVLHISVTPQQFSDGATSLTGGMLADLMADESHRDFWNPIKLVRRMVADVTQQRAADFLFTTTVAAAKGVFRAAGFKPFASIGRYVLPLRWPYPLLRRLHHGYRRPALSAFAYDDARMPGILRRFHPAGFFRTVPDPDYYVTRMPRWSYPAGTWLAAGAQDGPDALVLVSPTSLTELTVADVLTRDDSVGLAGTLSSVARWGARRGYRKMSLSTINGSRFATIAARAGFLARPEGYNLYVLSLKGGASVPPTSDWLFTPFVLSAW